MLDSTKIIFTKHALKRWNERMGSHINIEQSLRQARCLDVVGDFKKALKRKFSHEDWFVNQTRGKVYFYNQPDDVIFVTEPIQLGEFKVITCLPKDLLN